MASELDLKQFIRNIPDFPKPGIMFRDITPLLASAAAFGESVRRMAEHYRAAEPTAILAAEARGFIFAAPLALELGASFVPIRKPGKLPFDTRAFHYELEYGSDSLELHTDSVQKGDRVLLVDDLLATGGTMHACTALTEECGAEIAGLAFLIELDFLGGREKLGDYEVLSLIHYGSES